MQDAHSDTHLALTLALPELFTVPRSNTQVLPLTSPSPLLAAALSQNTHAALSTALLLLPPRFTELDLYTRIAGISYAGDPRMSVPGAENPDKVRNIVSGEGAREGMRGLYGGAMARLGVGYGHGEGDGNGNGVGMEGVSESASGPAPALAKSRGDEKQGGSLRSLDWRNGKGEGEGGEEVMLQVSINCLPQYPLALRGHKDGWGQVMSAAKDETVNIRRAPADIAATHQHAVPSRPTSQPSSGRYQRHPGRVWLQLRQRSQYTGSAERVHQRLGLALARHHQWAPSGRLAYTNRKHRP